MKFKGFGQAEPFSKGQFQELLSKFKSPHHRLIFALAWYTTERPITVLRLKVDQVYADAEKSKPLDKMLIPSHQRKDRKTREFPISKALQWELKAYEPPLAGYLFPGKGADSHLCWSSYDKALRRVLNMHGLKGYSTYSTRRGSLTELANTGLSMRALQAVSGHADLSSLGRYVDVPYSTIERAAALL